jgi:hypothetical protein
MNLHNTRLTSELVFFIAYSKLLHLRITSSPHPTISYWAIVDRKQKANERKAKGVHWQPLDINAVKDPAVTDTVGNGESWCEQRAKLDIVSSRQPRAKTVSSPPASIDPSLPDSVRDAETARKKRPNRQNRRKKTAENKNMAQLLEKAYVQPHLREGAQGPQSAQVPKSAYVPPHLRKLGGKATTPPTTAINGEQTTNSAPRESTVESMSSKLENTDNPHSSP